MRRRRTCIFNRMFSLACSPAARLSLTVRLSTTATSGRSSQGGSSSKSSSYIPLVQGEIVQHRCSKDALHGLLVMEPHVGKRRESPFPDAVDVLGHHGARARQFDVEQLLTLSNRIGVGLDKSGG